MVIGCIEKIIMETQGKIQNGNKMKKTLGIIRYALCGVLCFVSIVLTACFALSFGSGGEGISESTTINKIYPVILITIGVVLDLSKYIFWSARDVKGKVNYTGLAVVLMAFSWMASVAFFITNEEKNVTTHRKETAEYTAYLSELKSIDSVINQKSMQSEKRLDSRFHDQWDKSEELTDSIEELYKRRMALIASESGIGLSEAQEIMVSMAFFQSISKITSVEPRSVRNSFYGALALLIELCAFGLIALCKIEDDDRKNEGYCDVGLEEQDSVRLPENIKNKGSNEKFDVKPLKTVTVGKRITGLKKPERYNAEEMKLINDIKNGKTSPIFNQLKELNYDISQAKMRKILQDLKSQGVLVSGARRSLELAKRPLSAVSE